MYRGGIVRYRSCVAVRPRGCATGSAPMMVLFPAGPFMLSLLMCFALPYDAVSTAPPVCPPQRPKLPAMPSAAAASAPKKPHVLVFLQVSAVFCSLVGF